MKINKKIVFLIALGLSLLCVVQTNHPATVNASVGRMHYLKGCNGARDPFKRIGKFMGVVMERPIQTYDIHGHMINKEWYGNIYSNGYRYINGKKYYHMAFKTRKYVSAAQLSAHNSKNFPGRLTVYTATKKITAKAPDECYPDGSLSDMPCSISKGQPIFRDRVVKKGEIDYIMPAIKEWESTGKEPDPEKYYDYGLNLNALKMYTKSWYITAALNTFTRDYHHLSAVPDPEQMLIIPSQQQYFKRGGRYVEGYYHMRKTEGLQFTNQSVKQGYCWSDIHRDSTDNFYYQRDHVSCGPEPADKGNLVRIFNVRKYPNGHHTKKSLFKVNLYI